MRNIRGDMCIASNLNITKWINILTAYIIPQYMYNFCFCVLNNNFKEPQKDLSPPIFFLISESCSKYCLGSLAYMNSVAPISP